jgi:hypothetical protein
MAKKIHRSARGEAIDFDLLHSRNSGSVAVGNVPMNARGDRLGKGGKILQKVEEIDSSKLPPVHTTEYNKRNPRGIKMVSLKNNLDDLATKMTDPKNLPSIDDAKTPAAVFQRSENAAPKRKIVDSE